MLLAFRHDRLQELLYLLLTSTNPSVAIPMLRLLRLFWSLLWSVFAVAVIGAAVLLTLVRLLLPMAQHYREEIASWASSVIGQKVQITGLDANWQGLSPVLQLRGVNITGGQYGHVEIETIDISLNLLASLHQLRVVPMELSVVRPHITVLTLDVPESSERSWSFNDSGLWQLGLGQSRVSVRDARICAMGGRVRGCLTGDAYLYGDGKRLWGDANLHLPGAWGETVHMTVDAHRDDTKPHYLDGEWYLEAKGLRLAPLIHRLRSEMVADGALDFRVWGDLGFNRIAGVVDQLRMQTGDASQGPRDLSLAVDGFSWEQGATGWQLDVAGLRPAGVPATVGTTFQLRVDGPVDARELWLRAQGVYLSQLAFLAGVEGVLPGSVASAVATLAPHGKLDEVQLHIPLENKTDEDLWQVADLQVSFRGISNRPWRDIPGFDGLSGSLRLTEGTAALAFEESHGTLYLANLCREPWDIKHLAGSAILQRAATGWHLNVPKVSLATPDLALETGVSLWLPQPDPAGVATSPRLDLDGQLMHADASRLATYLPRRVMPYPAVTWLERSILGGKISQGNFHFHGKMADFPFDHGGGRFTVNCQLTGGELNYDNDWPALHALDLNLAFHGRAMEIQVHSGRIMGSALETTTAVIADLDHDPPLLQLHGRVRGPMADIPRLIQESPLSHKYGQYVATLEGRGAMSLTLALDMYTKPVDILHVAGRLDLQKADLHWHAPEVMIGSASGALEFSAEGIHCRKITAHIFGLPVELALQSRAAGAKGEGAATVIDVRGQFEPSDVRTYLPASILRDIHGRTNWQATVTLPEIPPGGKAMPSIRLSSTLQGLALDLPAPLSKTALQSQALLLETALGGGVHEIRVGYGTLASAVVELDKDDHLTRGEVRLGKGVATLPTPAGFHLRADLAQTALDDWLHWMAGFSEHARPAAADAQGINSAIPVAVEAKIGDLRWSDHHFHDVALTAGAEKNGWGARFTARETTGRLHWSEVSGVDLDLDRLILVKNGTESPPKETQENTESATDPRHLPALHILCEDLHMVGSMDTPNKKNEGTVASKNKKTNTGGPAKAKKSGDVALGRLEISTHPDQEGLAVTNMELRAPNFQVNGTGYWHVVAGAHANTASQVSGIEVGFDIPNLGNTLSTLGYAETVEGGVGKAKLQMEWPGSLGDFAVDDLAGTLSFQVEKGRLVHVDPGETGRIFGLLSLQALPRRLAFDFSDVFKTGLGFDQIRGDFRIEHGNAYSKNLVLNGPAAAIAVEGRAGLAARDYDQLVTVTPNVGGTLPLAGALAAGSVGIGVGVGAAILLAQHLFKPGLGLDRITQIRYTLRGSWDDPVVEPLPATSDGAAH